MSSEVAVQRAIALAERILPGMPAPEGKRDPRWQAIIRVGKFIEAHPEAVWHRGCNDRYADRGGALLLARRRAAVAGKAKA
jgi:hypothetical protein